MKLDPWQKIMRAAKRETGLRLTADEVWRLSCDDAIREAATQDRFTDNHPELVKRVQNG